jgi:hypothetical protein
MYGSEFKEVPMSTHFLAIGAKVIFLVIALTDTLENSVY